jgi:hypothetical protein
MIRRRLTAACRDGPREHSRQAARSERSRTSGQASNKAAIHVRCGAAAALIAIEGYSVPGEHLAVLWPQTDRGAHRTEDRAQPTLPARRWHRTVVPHCTNPCMTSRAWIAEHAALRPGSKVEASFQTVTFVEG